MRSPAAGSSCCVRRSLIWRTEPTYAAEVESTDATCSLCGASEPEQPLTWTAQSDQGRTRLVCDVCTRLHLRAMEARLDEEHW